MIMFLAQPKKKIIEQNKSTVIGSKQNNGDFR